MTIIREIATMISMRNDMTLRQTEQKGRISCIIKSLPFIFKAVGIFLFLKRNENVIFSESSNGFKPFRNFALLCRV